MHQRTHLNRTGGFSFIEVMMVMAVLVLLAGLAIPFYQSFQVSSGLDNTTREVASALRRTQGLAMGSQQWSAWGVHIGTHQYVIFPGTVYNPSEPKNEIFTIPQSITLSSSAGADIVFSRIKGETANAGTLTLQTVNNEAASITINQRGIINVQ
ncbi:MAG: prepilin-type N-terminal cleavage/methylation domain-containing protein [Patescibacteria group bacterium]